jgi:hypothetical protein
MYKPTQFRGSASPDIFRTKRSGAEQPADMPVNFRADPDITVESGLAPFWRLKPGQLFVILPEDALADQSRSYVLYSKQSDSFGVPALRQNVSSVSFAARQRVVIIPKQVPRATLEDCDCAGVGWLISEDTRLAMGTLVIQRCDACELFGCDAEAAAAAIRAGLPVAMDHPYVLRDTEPRLSHFEVELKIRNNNSRPIDPLALLGVIRSACDSSAIYLHEIDVKRADPVRAPITPSLPIERTRSIDLPETESQEPQEPT